MNICIESSALNFSNRSGLMTYTEGLLNSLGKADKFNDYYLTYYSLRRNAENMPGHSGKNFHKIVLRFPDGEFWKRQFLLDKLILPNFFKTKKIRIFHRPSGYTMPSVKNVYKILTIHDLRTLTIGDKYWIQNIADYQNTINSLDMCLVVSECTKQDLIKNFNIDEKKIKVIYLGADQRFCPSSEENIKNTLSKYQINKPFLFSVGSVPRKNIDGVIRSFAGSKVVKDYQLVLGCYMDIEKYTLLVKELNIANRVIFLPKLNDQDMIDLYSACRVFVFPSLYEGFGLPILEAMQCGAPVITSNVSSCPEIAGDAALLVDPNNIGQISDAINEIHDNLSLRKNLITKGYSRAAHFSWDKFAKEMMDIFSLAK